MANNVQQLHVIPIDRDMKELTARGTPDFPVAMYDNDYAEFLTGRVPWHWHPETELIYVVSGEISLRYGERSAVLSAGEGAFIRSNTLHSMVRTVPGSRCKQLSVVFSPSLIAGLPQGVCEQKFIHTLVNCHSLPAVPLRPDVLWQADALRAILAAFEAYRAHEYGYELAVVEQLTGVWRRIVQENRAALDSVQGDADDGRIKTMLIFLQQNYMRRLTLEQIAASANISPRACTRCFRERMHTTPFTYLNALRIRVAAEKLRHTELPVGEIGTSVGFEGESYFSKVFKSALGCTPRAYRRQPPAIQPFTK